MDKPKPFKKGEALSAKKLNQLNNSIPNRIVGGQGISVRYNGNGDIIVGLTGRLPGIDPTIRFKAEITNSTEIGSSNIYHYGWRQVELVKLGDEESYQAVSAGYAGSFSDDTYAINTIEINTNSSSGTQGNNIDLDYLNELLDFMPIASGVVVEITLEPIKGDGSIESGLYGYRPTFQLVNSIDGDCTP